MCSDLLILACSDRKRAQPQRPLAALERYDGVSFRVLRKWLRGTDRTPPEVLIISARYGLIDAATPIRSYDQRMNRLRATKLAPQIEATLQQRIRGAAYRRVFVNVGKGYLHTLASAGTLSSVTWAKGGIGQRARQMKQWLEAAL